MKFSGKRILYFMAGFFLAVGLLTSNPSLLAFNFCLILLVVVCSLLEHLFIANVRPYRRFHQTALTGDQVTVEIGLANHNSWHWYNAVVTDRFGLVRSRDEAVIFEPRVEPKSLNTATYLGECGERRGRFIVGPLSVKLADPFGLTETAQTFENSELLTVYPRGFVIDDLPLAARASQFDVHLLNAEKSGISDEFRGLREYRPGDSPRWIHWPHSLRLGEMVVRDFEQPAARNFALLLDLNKDTFKGIGTKSTIEYSVQIAMAIASYAVRNHHRVSLYGMAENFVHVPPGSGEGHLHAVMETLLGLEQNGDVPFDQFLVTALEYIPIDSIVVLIFPTSLINIDDYLGAIGVLHGRKIGVTAVLIRDELFYRFHERDYSVEVAHEEVIDSLLSSGIPVYTIDSLKDLAVHFHPLRLRRPDPRAETIT